MYSLLIANVIRRGSPHDWVFVPIALAFGLAAYGVRKWRFFVQWLRGNRGKDWTLLPAVIDVVTVTEQTEQTRGGERTIGYLATLTYFYHNPDLQMGEYYRMFDEEGEAKAWAEPMKGCSVMVHVDARDPSRSALRDDELDKVAPVPPWHE